MHKKSLICTKSQPKLFWQWLLSHLYDWLALLYFISATVLLFIFHDWLFSLNLLETILLCMVGGSIGGIIWGIPQWESIIKRKIANRSQER